MARIGNPIFLQCWLEDGRSDKYIKAICRNVSGVELLDSPATLVHVGEGLYINNSDVIFPLGTEKVTATYLVYDDPGFTTKSFDYYNGDDVFSLDYDLNIENDLYRIYRDLEVLVNSITSDLTGEIDDMACITGEIEDTVLLVGEIDDGGVIGFVDEEDVLIGEIENCPD